MILLFGLAGCVLFFPQAVLASRTPKKGIAGPGCSEVNCADEHLTQLGPLLENADISWFYTWRFGSTDAYWTTGKEYVPNAPGNTSKIREMIETRNYWGGYWLLGNEPDNGTQDNKTPYEAARDYGSITYNLLSVDPQAKIIILGLCWPNLSWKNSFANEWQARWGESVEDAIAGWHVHAYAGRPSEIETRKDQIRDWITANPGKELWITEYGSLYESDIRPEAVQELGTFFELTPGVTRYAFFYFGYPQTGGRWENTSLYIWRNNQFQATPLAETYRQTPRIPNTCELLPPHRVGTAHRLLNNQYEHRNTFEAPNDGAVIAGRVLARNWGSVICRLEDDNQHPISGEALGPGAMGETHPSWKFLSWWDSTDVNSGVSVTAGNTYHLACRGTDSYASVIWYGNQSPNGMFDAAYELYFCPTQEPPPRPRLHLQAGTNQVTWKEGLDLDQTELNQLLAVCPAILSKTHGLWSPLQPRTPSDLKPNTSYHLKCNAELTLN